VKTEETIFLTIVNSILLIFVSDWYFLFVWLNLHIFVLSYIGKWQTDFKKGRHRQMTVKLQCPKRNNETTFDRYCGLETKTRKIHFSSVSGLLKVFHFFPTKRLYGLYLKCTVTRHFILYMSSDLLLIYLSCHFLLTAFKELFGNTKN
jgi:hypothetical protein